MGGGYGCELQFECVFGLLLPGGLRIFWCFGICSWDAFGISSLSSLILALLTWRGALRTINQTREAHKPAKPTNSWGALRTMIQLDGPQSGPSSFVLALADGAFRLKFKIKNLEIF